MWIYFHEVGNVESLYSGDSFVPVDTVALSTHARGDFSNIWGTCVGMDPRM